MSRLLLALSLNLFASAALANGPAAIDGGTDLAAKPGKTTAVVSTQDSDSASTGHSAATPARSGTPRVSPRWHSLLPGMIR